MKLKIRVLLPPSCSYLFLRCKLFNFYKKNSLYVTRGNVVVFSIKKILLAECFLCIREAVTTTWISF